MAVVFGAGCVVRREASADNPPVLGPRDADRLMTAWWQWVRANGRRPDDGMVQWVRASHRPMTAWWHGSARRDRAEDDM